MKELFSVSKSELPVGSTFRYAEDGQNILLYYDGEAYFAFDAECPHKQGDLCGGPVRNGVITCPWHRFRFDLTTGESVTNKNLRLHIYTVEVKEDSVHVNDPRRS